LFCKTGCLPEGNTLRTASPITPDGEPGRSNHRPFTFERSPS
jgi:hypothetical protein